LIRDTCKPTPANSDFHPVTGCVRTTGWAGANASPTFNGDPRGDMSSYPPASLADLKTGWAQVAVRVSRKAANGGERRS
jgi:hypothetical protein